MGDNVVHLILEHLRAMRTDISAIREDVWDVKQRLTSLELSVRLEAGLCADIRRYDRTTYPL